MQQLLIIGYVWPEPGSSAAGRRMLEIIHLFLEQGWSITFASSAAASSHQYDLSEIGVQQVSIELNSESFDHWLATAQPQVVIFDRFMLEEQFGWRVARVCPEAVRILDTEDLHLLRQARQQAVSKHLDVSEPDINTETAIREVASIYRCDLSLIISEFELQLLKDRFFLNDDLLHYLPFIARLPGLSSAGFNQRKDFVFVGTMRHAPNLDAVRHLKLTIWPKIRTQLPGVNLYLVGSYMTKEVSQMHRPAEGFHVEGKKEQLDNYLQGMRVSLVPLRFGAGLKGKLLEAMENGLPSVTTSIGAEGINGDSEWPGHIADDDDAFVAAAVELYQNEQYWNRAQQSGYELLTQRFSKQQHAQPFFSRLDDLKQSLGIQRDKNFIGRMLQHHSMRSTEYMARWIECKNKKGDSV